MQQSQDSSYIIPEISNRLRLLERKNYSLNEKLLIINQNMIEEHRKVLQEIKGLKVDIKEIKGDLIETQTTVKQIIREMNNY